jgi:1-acyl-sn-glycerol-3-phosphate acyltransferase
VSLAAAAKPESWPVAATTFVRLSGLVLALAGFVVAFGPPRRLAQRLGSRWGERTPVLFQRLLCTGLGVKVRQHGALSAGGCRLIAANHVSWLDIPVLGSLAPMSFLAKRQIGDHPIGREFVAMQGVVYVDRERRRCIPEVNARMAEAMRAGSPVVLFPEATTGDGNRLLKFRSSHFEAIRQAAGFDNRSPAFVQPVYLHYSRLAGLPMVRFERPRIAWYGDMTFMRHLARFLGGGGVTCDVYCGEPIHIRPNMDRKTAARLSATAVRKLADEAHAKRAPAIFAGREKP